MSEVWTLDDFGEFDLEKEKQKQDYWQATNLALDDARVLGVFDRGTVTTIGVGSDLDIDRGEGVADRALRRLHRAGEMWTLWSSARREKSRKAQHEITGGEGNRRQLTEAGPMLASMPSNILARSMASEPEATRTAAARAGVLQGGESGLILLRKILPLCVWCKMKGRISSHGKIRYVYHHRCHQQDHRPYSSTLTSTSKRSCCVNSWWSWWIVCLWEKIVYNCLTKGQSTSRPVIFSTFSFCASFLFVVRGR